MKGNRLWRSGNRWHQMGAFFCCLLLMGGALLMFPGEVSAGNLQPNLLRSAVLRPQATASAASEMPEMTDVAEVGQQLPTGSASVEVYAFKDSNDNGAAGKYEKPIQGVEISAMIHLDGGTTALAGFCVTDANGRASIVGLGDGTYTIRAVLPDGFGYARKGRGSGLDVSIMDTSVDTVQETAPITLVSSQQLQMGIGILTMARVTGYAWFDDSGDGIRQAGEPPLAGVEVELEGTKNGFKYQTVTGEDGVYTVVQVRPGTYRLRFKAPEGHAFTVYSRTGGEARSVITTEGRSTGSKEVKLSPGETLDKQNVGFISDAGIFGMAFMDANYNGLYDEGEAPLPNVELEIYRQIMDKPLAKTKSAKDGTFSFTGLRSATYRLRVVLPDSGVTFTKVVRDPGVVGNLLRARPGRRENSIENIALAQGERYEVAVGAIQPASLSGYAYLDDNFSGTRDKGEKIAQGLVVTLRDEEGNVIASDKTNAKGKYSFTNLNPGTYVLHMAAKPGYAFSKPGEGNVMGNAGGGNGQSAPFALELGEARTEVNLGMILPGVVEGMFYADADDDGQWDETESGLTGGTVALLDEASRETVFTADIGREGTFRFDAVMPGTYQLAYTLPEGAIFATGTESTHTLSEDGTSATGKAFPFTVGETVTAPLVGGLTLGKIEGAVFADADGDGSQSPSESPVAGATMTLTPRRDDLSPMVVATGPDGEFQLDGLHPDTYTLAFSAPDGQVISRLQGVSLPLTTGENQVEVTLPFTMGQQFVDQAIGVVAPASLSGTAWLDENNNGTREAEEKLLSGLTIRVVDEAWGETFATLTTDAEGQFSTHGLVPGRYGLHYSLAAGEAAAPAGDSTFQPQGVDLVMDNITLQPDDQRTDALLGLIQYTTLGGKVWVDRGDVVEPLPGAAVTLTAAGQPAKTISSGEDGLYAFNGLLPGTYTLSVELPAGQLVVAPDDARLTDGQHISIMTAIAGRTGNSEPVHLTMGADQLMLHIGSVLPGKVGDLAWLDENGNGLQDSDELGIPGVTITLMKDGAAQMETTTDAYGYYHFGEVYPATYTLQVSAPAEVIPTRTTADFPGIGSILKEGSAPYATEPFQVKSDARQYSADLGFVLVTPGKYPAEYGEGPTQDWTRVRLGK